MMRVFAISDIHGCIIPLRKIIEEISLHKSDTLVILGDFIGRGHHSSEVIDYILNLSDRFKVISLQGNHEQYMIKAKNNPSYRSKWASHWGKEVLHSYPGGIFEDIPASHWEFLIDTCQEHYETETHIFVHSHADAFPSISKQDSHTLRYHLLHVAGGHASGKMIICGHNVQRSWIPSRAGQSLFIDTGAGFGGWLSCFETTQKQFWQANESGELRKFSLNDACTRPLYKRIANCVGTLFL